MKGTGRSGPASSGRRRDADDCSGPSGAGQSEAIPDATLLQVLRAARKRLVVLSRRLRELHDRRDIAARVLSDEVEQVLIGLDLVERRPPSASVGAFAAKLRHTAESVQESLQRLEEFRRNGAKGTAQGERDTREGRGSRRIDSHRKAVRRTKNSRR